MLKTITVKNERITGSEDVVVVPLYKGARTLDGVAARLDRTCRSALSEQLKAKRFRGELGETSLVRVTGARAPEHVMLLGLGEKGKMDAERAAHAGGAASSALGKARFKAASVLLADVVDEDSTRFVRAMAKGIALAQYRFGVKEKPTEPGPLRKVSFLGGPRAMVSKESKAGLVIAEHAAMLRDLVNTPADTITPSELARRARALCKDAGMKCTVLSRAAMEREGMGALLAVARGSAQEPKLIAMHYNASRDDLPTVCLVGKGVTFDTGGISIKPWSGMHEMKGDMAGGGLVIAAVAAAARLQLPVQVIGVIPTVENMPDGTAFRPGDIVRTYSGKTIEVFTTDAEGRLILSDALTWVRKNYQPEVIVDFATLTGAVLIALGTRIAGIMGNSQEHIDALLEAGLEAGEPVWQLPLDDHFYEMIKGDISDYKNYGGRNAGTITAAALLGKFVEDAPWVHVDIAGTFWNDGSGPPYQSKGATGYGVDLAIAFLEKLAGR